ncbi:unnamed protein product [Brassica oleracea var. botrytis]|uniref:(rape) hypothetical protein n=1 Tax=Brassica napus TaxID=3708 RepID=A0A816MVF5_BRANA|nr:unnamed protein product [Brassica napus]
MSGWRRGLVFRPSRLLSRILSSTCNDDDKVCLPWWLRSGSSDGASPFPPFEVRTSFVLQNKIPEREREKPRRCLKRMPHSDGASPSRPFSEEDRQWFMEAMQGHTIDSISRMKQISQIMKMPEHLLDSQGVTTSDLEGMLDELQEHVESIDLANGLISYTKHFFVLLLHKTFFLRIPK